MPAAMETRETRFARVSSTAGELCLLGAGRIEGAEGRLVGGSRSSSVSSGGRKLERRVESEAATAGVWGILVWRGGCLIRFGGGRVSGSGGGGGGGEVNSIRWGRLDGQSEVGWGSGSCVVSSRGKGGRWRRGNWGKTRGGRNLKAEYILVACDVLLRPQLF